LIEGAGFQQVEFSTHRYDSFSDAAFPSADAVEFGTEGVDIRGIKPAR